MDNRLRTIFASSLAAIAVIVVTVGVTIAGELSLSLKDWLKSFTGHHWVTKSWLSIIIYVFVFTALQFLLPRCSEKTVRIALNAVTVIAIIGGVVLTVFFYYEYIVK